MIVAIDTQLAVGTATGIGVYQRDLAAALRAEQIDVRELSAPNLDPWRFDRRVLWDQIVLPWQAARSRATLLHATAGTMPLIRTLPTIVTVHDLAWHRVQSHTPAYARAYFGALQARAYRSAAAIICDSNFSASEYRDLIDKYALPHVIYPGVDARFATLDRNPDPNPFALVVGTVEARKNLLVLVEALPEIPIVRIISTGPPTPYVDEIKRRAAELGVAGRIDLRGYVAGNELSDLYARATLALIPSRYEGFGYALAEALCAGVPAIAAKTSSLIEVAADNNIPLLPPDDVDAWISTIRDALTNRDAEQAAASSRRADAITRFGWQTAARATIAVYRHVASA